jgi:hypothetical protein
VAFHKSVCLLKLGFKKNNGTFVCIGNHVPPSPEMNAKRELPAKENAIFKNILVSIFSILSLLYGLLPDQPIRNRLQRNYEHKQYKKGLKLADTILKKFPEHGGMDRSREIAVIGKVKLC